MDLTFQVPMQYCSFQHWTLLPSPVISTTGWCFCFGSISSFFLDLFLQTRGVPLLVSYLFAFHTVHGVLKARILSGLPFPSPVDHILSDLSTMTHPSWVTLRGMAHSFIELNKAVVHVIRLVFCDCGFQSVCPLMEKDKRLMKAS